MLLSVAFNTQVNTASFPSHTLTSSGSLTTVVENNHVDYHNVTSLGLAHPLYDQASLRNKQLK